jgi:hypothetical protein
MKEQNVLKKIMIAVSGRTKIFRNNTGTGWVGKSIHIRNTTTMTLNAGDVVIRNARPLKAGLVKGGSDLIGWTEQVVTPQMVGQKVAIFTAIEVKKSNKHKASDEQIRFLNAIKRGGGFAGVAWDCETAQSITSGNI